MQAVLLIGGRGSRLGSLAKTRPKPLLEVAGRPFVQHLIHNLRRFGFDRFLLLAGHLSAVVEELVGPNTPFARGLAAELTIVAEPDVMGTGGALAFAEAHLAETFLLLNSDSLFDFNVLDLTIAPGADWLGRVALCRMPDARRYGLVALEGGRITRFLDKPTEATPGIINGGVYWLKRDLVSRITNHPCSLESEIFPALATEGRLDGVVYEGLFIDIDIPDDLARADRELASKFVRPAVFLDRDGTLNHDTGYTHRIQDFRWIDGVPQLIKRLNDAGVFVFVVSNQAGIARGYYEPPAVERLHRWMMADLVRIGAHVDDFRFCPHHPEGSIADYSRPCLCRKPMPGMINDLLARWSVDRNRSVMIGDKATDAAAGRNAGIEGVTVPAGGLADPIETFLNGLPQA
jgi:D-glycero-D-manno-heptose 1,7-bisphosphate phosphatase